jgi:hypothetical protein
MAIGEEHVAAVAKVRALLAEGASVVEIFHALDGGFMFALLDAIPIGLVTARVIAIEIPRNPDTYAHLHLRELEHLARVFAFARCHGFTKYNLESAILRGHRVLEFNAATTGATYRYVTDDPEVSRSTGRTGRTLAEVRAEVTSAMLDTEWDGELRILVDEPTRLVIEFPRIR